MSTSSVTLNPHALSTTKKASMGLGRLILRITVGAVFVEHGTQKLLDWFGGAGPDGTGTFFESIGLRPGRPSAVLAGTSEVGGGVLLAAGLATPAAAAALLGVMATALRTAVWPEGIRAGTGGYEMLLAVAALAVAEEGPGPWSLDAVLGQERSGPGWAAAALGAGVLGSVLVTTTAARRRHTETAPPPEGPPRASTADKEARQDE